MRTLAHAWGGNIGHFLQLGWLVRHGEPRGPDPYGDYFVVEWVCCCGREARIPRGEDHAVAAH